MFSITAAGTYQITSETGAFPINGDATVDRNNDDNSFTITVSSDDSIFGLLQVTIQHDASGTLDLPYFFFVAPSAAGSSQLNLRNFDVDGNASSVTYTKPDGTTIAGTVSDNGVWNGGGDLNTGSDAVTATGLAAAAGGDAGLWQFRIEDLTSSNQVIFEAVGGSVVLALIDKEPTTGGNFSIKSSGTLTTQTGVPVDHTFTVTNLFAGRDVFNLSLSGTAPNTTAQLLTAAGDPLTTDADGDGILDTGFLAPDESITLRLRVTLGAGAPDVDNTVISAVSLIDRKVDPVNNTTRSITRTTSRLPTLEFAQVSSTAAEDAGATCVLAEGEADAHLVALARSGTVCCVLTDDCDLVALGAPRCLFAAKLAAAGDGRPTLVGSEFELRALGASGTFLGWPRERFVAFCVACGCDYAKNVPGVGPARALALSAGAADAEVVLQRLLREPRCPEGFADAFRAAVRLFTAGD